MDVETVTFITARPEIRLDSDVAALTDSDTTLSGALAQSRMYALLEGLVSSQALPALAGCAFRGTLGGQLRSSRRLSGTVEPAGYRRTDWRDASHRPADGIEFELGQLREGKTGRAGFAYRLDQEIAAGAGLAALTGVAKTTPLG